MISRPSLSTEYLGFLASLNAILQAVEAEAADGILAFSMGGASTCCALAALHVLTKHAREDPQAPPLGLVLDCLRACPEEEVPGGTSELLQGLIGKIRDGERAAAFLRPLTHARVICCVHHDKRRLSCRDE